MRITVVIPTFNRALQLKQCLESLTVQTLSDKEYEVIVVDDSSTDNTFVEYSRLNLPASFKYIKQQHGGSSAARNKGAREAKGELILFFDDDVVADKNLLKSHLEAHKKWPHSSVLGFTPFAEGLPRTSVMEYHRTRWDNIFNAVDFFQGQREIPFNFFITLNLSVERSDLETIGLFNVSFNAAFEDTELGLRFANAGIPHRFCKEALAWHRPVLTEKSLTERQMRDGYRAGHYYKDHPDNKAMNDAMNVNHVLGYPHRERSMLSRFRESLRQSLLNSKTVNILLFLGASTPRLVPFRLAQYFLKLVVGYYYAKGFRQALLELSDNEVKPLTNER